MASVSKHHALNSKSIVYLKRTILFTHRSSTPIPPTWTLEPAPTGPINDILDEFCDETGRCQPMSECLTHVLSPVTTQVSWYAFMVINMILVRFVPTIIICSLNPWMYLRWV